MSDDNVPPAFNHRPSFCSGRCCGRGPTGWPTSSSESIRQVMAAWIVALFFLVAGFSILALS